MDTHRANITLIANNTDHIGRNKDLVKTDLDTLFCKQDQAGLDIYYRID